MKTGKRVAIFHDYFGALGGGEKVVIELAGILGADIITTESSTEIPPQIRVITLGRTIPFPGLRQISAGLRFFFCNFSQEYDLFILSGNWAHFAAHRHHPNIWYCHILVPAMYDNEVGFVVQRNPIRDVLFGAWKTVHSWVDRWSVNRVDRIIANSSHIRQKIMRYYNRSADLVYPPVETEKYHCRSYEDFWLSVNRIYPEKRIELQIESFRLIPEERLVIVGGGSSGDHSSAYARSIKKTLPSNVEMTGQIPQEVLIDLYARCRGFLCTSYDEPFGIAPVEAMASGKPVVAVDAGGYRETVTSDTGILVKPDAREIALAVRTISRNPSQYHGACVLRAGKFDRGIFLDRILDIIKKIPKERTD